MHFALMVMMKFSAIDVNLNDTCVKSACASLVVYCGFYRFQKCCN